MTHLSKHGLRPALRARTGRFSFVRVGFRDGLFQAQQRLTLEGQWRE